eukprot:g66306.t1
MSALASYLRYKCTCRLPCLSRFCCFLAMLLPASTSPFELSSLEEGWVEEQAAWFGQIKEPRAQTAARRPGPRLSAVLLALLLCALTALVGRLLFLASQHGAPSRLHTADAEYFTDRGDRRDRKDHKDGNDVCSALEVASLMSTLQDLDQLGRDNQGNRATGTSGYSASVQYVLERLQGTRYTPVLQTFPVTLWRLLSAPALAYMIDGVTAQAMYGADQDFLVLGYSGSTPARGLVGVPRLPTGSDLGCSMEDYAGWPVGSMALVGRGSCTFTQKANVAKEAGAIAVLIYNNVPGMVIDASLSASNPNFGVPALSLSKQLGELLAAALGSGQDVQLDVKVLAELYQVDTTNILVDTLDGDPDQTIVLGAHLDSVTAGIGINDDGSGSATVLEIALLMDKLKVKPRNRVRFAWWAAEELGLLGSLYYLSSLPRAELEQISCNINLDMLASPNYYLAIYNGRRDDPKTPGSGIIQDVFEKHFLAAGNKGKYFFSGLGGGSDYAGFQRLGIPIAGLFSGANGVKTPEQAAANGGTAGQPYDVCYHQPCDGFSNANPEGYAVLAKAAACVTEELSQKKKLNNFLMYNPSTLPDFTSSDLQAVSDAFQDSDKCGGG